VTPGWRRFFAIVSWLGEFPVIALATVAVAVPLRRRYGTVVAAAWIAAQAGGGLLNLALKGAFERAQPEFADPLLASSSWSFPSGHAMGTFVLWGLGCYLLLRELRSWTATAVLVAVTLAWCVVMSFSRLYLGSHFASDVVAGMIAGAAWVAVCASAFEVLRRRRGTSL
jgi:membrane-associated phospholipid phosphatase